MAKEQNDPVFGSLCKNQRRDNPDEPKRMSTSFNIKTTDDVKSVKSRGSSGSLVNNTNYAKMASTSKTGVKHFEARRYFLCNKEHLMNYCEKFASLNPSDKLDTLKQYKLCFNCMAGRHAAKWCKATTCSCGGKHAAIFHDDLETANTND